jgi:hypothetical protein
VNIKSMVSTATIIFAFNGLIAFAQENDQEKVVAEMSKLDFIVAHWSSLSTFVETGKTALGDLRYTKVLGGAWILCEFRGDHPDRRVWEAYEMITYDAASGKYLDYGFFSSGGPVIYSGEWTSEDTVTFTSEDGRAGGQKDRISYSKRPEGWVFQLNEAQDDSGSWKSTLETIYQSWRSELPPIPRVELPALDPVVEETAKLNFLVGKWTTVSWFVQAGIEAPGTLSYQNILGGKYILCKFQGEVPGRPFWEAYAFITHDPGAGCYRSHAFFGPPEPAVYSGAWITEDTVTFTNDNARPDGTRDRINYTRLPEGTVFQLNEVCDAQGVWHATLETDYNR